MDLAPNFLVEVRDRDFTRLGQISPEYLDIKFTEVFRGVGVWEMKLPSEHPRLEDLKTPGSGIIITETYDDNTSHIYSGRMRSCVLSQDAADPKGTWVISGVDDGVMAQASVVYPDPAADSAVQTLAYWNYASNGENVMKQAIYLNQGAGALAARQYSWLSVATSLNRGSSASANARFDVLGDVLQAVGVQSGLGWRYYQAGAGVVFDVTVPRDLTDLIRLNIENGGLESTELGFSAPTATRVLVLGQGEGADRTVISVTSAAATAEAALWGIEWEQTKDQRNTNDTTELTEAGTEIINEGGTTIRSMKIAASDAPGQKLGKDWGLGDMVTVVIDGVEAQAVVTQTATAVGPAGVIKQATVGDPIGFDWEAKVGHQLKKQAARIDRLENYIDTNPIVPGAIPTGSMTMWMGSSNTPPTDWLIADGTAISRATYPSLFTAIGTAYGNGNGTTTFNLPDLKGRIPVGRDSGQAEFDTLGETGGAKTHTLTSGEMPSHTHTQNSHNHTQNSHNHTQNAHNHTQNSHNHANIEVNGSTVMSLSAASPGSGTFGLQSGTGGSPLDVSAATAVNQATTATNQAATATNNATTATNQATGGDGAHNNLQPYIVINYIIKT